ncbi:heme-binding protein 2-like isoform X1 [Alosa sapidissima]|uniref:heme-binding protein 2-like isoform X1 n=1 Tax=Alosa sapidissima TaxID=34773 RepID=UPI001C081FAB|nr:heme-binding protein 2-like isoform X1 [Alosa sapidissima]
MLRAAFFLVYFTTVICSRVYVAGIVVFVFALAVEAKVGDSSESSFCTESKECLLYNLTCTGNGYEVRRYEETKWVSVDVESAFMEMAISKAFWKLFRYIMGSNDAGMKIDMTAPVIIKGPDSRSMLQSSGFTISFLLPSTFQLKQTPIPNPTESSVYLSETPSMQVYVKSYGGWMSFISSRMQSSALRMALRAAGASYTTGFHYDVGYNSPMKMTDRHNEVWYLVEGKPVCSAV